MPEILDTMGSRAMLALTRRCDQMSANAKLADRQVRPPHQGSRLSLPCNCGQIYGLCASPPGAFLPSISGGDATTTVVPIQVAWNTMAIRQSRTAMIDAVSRARLQRL